MSYPVRAEGLVNMIKLDKNKQWTKHTRWNQKVSRWTRIYQVKNEHWTKDYFSSKFEMSLNDLTETVFTMRINFYFLRIFCPHLGSFCVVSSFSTFCVVSSFTTFFSLWFQLKTTTKFCTDPTMEDQIRRTNNWIYNTNKSILDRPSGPVAQLIEALSLYVSIVRR